MIFSPNAKPQTAQYFFSIFIEQVWIRTLWTKAVDIFIVKVELWQSPDGTKLKTAVYAWKIPLFVSVPAMLDPPVLI